MTFRGSDFVIIGLIIIIGLFMLSSSKRKVGVFPVTTVPAPAAPSGGGSAQPAFNILGCPQGIACSTSTSGDTRRECQNIGPIANYEATWCGTVSSGRELAFKFWGPYHTDKNCPGRGGSAQDCVGSASCCWCIMSVCTATGQFYMRSEGPHPDYRGNTCSGLPGSQGGTSKPLSQDQCIKAVVRQIPGRGANIKGYALEGGKWVQKLDWTGPCGSSYVLMAPVNHADFVFRLNGPHNTRCATVRPLGPKVAPGHPQRSSGSGV